MTSKSKYENLLNREECIKIAEKSCGENFKRLFEYKIDTPEKNVTGYLGEYYRLELLIEDQDGKKISRNYFIKTLPLHMETHRKLMEETGLYKKEVTLYEKLLNALQKYSKTKWLSECYYCRPDLLVFEDLFSLGYFHMMKFNELSFIKSILSSLAALHAGSLAYEIYKGIDIEKEFHDALWEFAIGRDINWFRTGVEALKAVSLLHPKYQTEEYQNFIRDKFHEKVDTVCDMVNKSLKFHNTLCHRDSWGNNIFFKDSEETTAVEAILKRSTIIVDFQTSRYCPPAIDVLFCVYTNTDREFRDEHFEELVNFYYSRLDEELKEMKLNSEEVLSKDEFLRSCKDLRLMAIVYKGLFTTQHRLPNDLLKKIKAEEPEKFFYYCNQNRSALILPLMEENEEYKKLMFDAVEEIVDWIYT